MRHLQTGLTPGVWALSVQTANTLGRNEERNASLWHPCPCGKGYSVDPGCAAEVAVCNEAELGGGHWRQRSQVASFLCHGLTPLHRPKSDRANWVGVETSETMSPSYKLATVGNFNPLMERPRKQWSKSLSLTHRYGMTFLRTSAAFFFSFRNLQNDPEIHMEIRGSCTVSSQSNPEE